MGVADELAVNLKVGSMFFFSWEYIKIKGKRSSSLKNSFSETSHLFFHPKGHHSSEGHDLYFSIFVRLGPHLLSGAFGLLSIFPDIGASCHKAIDVEKQQILVIFNFLECHTSPFQYRLIAS